MKENILVYLCTFDVNIGIEKDIITFYIFKLYSIKYSILVYLCTYLIFIIFKLYSMKENILVYLYYFNININKSE